jgi:hypothetical protein
VTRFFLIVLMAFAVAACVVNQKLGANYAKTGKSDTERMKVVYRYFSGKGEIQGMCKPDETIITVFCDNPSRYGEVIAPSANGSSRAIGTCSSTGPGSHRMTLSCGKP